MNADPRYTKDQVKLLRRIIERCKKANDDKGAKFYTELLEKGGADIGHLEVIPLNKDKKNEN